MEDLEGGVPPDALRFEGRAAWRVAERGPPLVVDVRGDEGRGGLARLVLEDVPVLGFRVETTNAVLRLLVDGEPLAEFQEATSADVALDAGRRVVAFVFEARASNASARLTLVGPVPLLPPLLVAPPVTVVACRLNSLVADVVYALALAAPAIEATWDGESADVDVRAWRDGLRLRNHVTIQTPASGPGEHELTLRVLGEEVLRQVVHVVTPGTGAHASPQSGWVYERQPVLHLAVWGCDSSAKATLEVNGVAIEDAHLWWRPPTPLAFNETLEYRWTVTFANREPLVLEGTLREGLDVVTLDRLTSALIWRAKPAGAGTDLSLTLTGGRDRPLLTTTAEVEFHTAETSHALLLPGAKLVAAYAPLELACASGRSGVVCSPYGGGAPEFQPWHTDLTVTKWRTAQTIPIAGQLAAAAHFSRLQTGELPELLVDADVRAAVGSLMGAAGAVEALATS